MKRLIFILALLLAAFSAAGQDRASATFGLDESDGAGLREIRSRMDSIRRHRPTVALVLSGGGAKGGATVGALRYMEQFNFPVDVVVGTSVGGLLGALYSLGYDVDYLEDLIQNIDWDMALSDNVDRQFVPYSRIRYRDRFVLSFPFYYSAEDFQNLIAGDYSTADVTKFVSYNATITPATGTNSQNLRFSVSHSYMSGNYHDRNWIFYRLTDVMLMQAEALIESAKYDDYEVTTVNEEGARVPLLDGDGNQVYDQDLKKAFELIWTVNRRSIMVPTTENTSAAAKYELSAKGLSRSMLRDLCIAERRRELMFEGKRWFDMLRRCHREGKVDYIKNHVPAKSGGMTPVNYEALFWPYNKNELKNNSLLEQKPYYGDSDDEGNYSSTK